MPIATPRLAVQGLSGTRDGAGWPGAPGFVVSGLSQQASASSQRTAWPPGQLHALLLDCRRASALAPWGSSTAGAFGLIAVEDLAASRMVHHHCRGKSLHH